MGLEDITGRYVGGAVGRDHVWRSYRVHGPPDKHGTTKEKTQRSLCPGPRGKRMFQEEGKSQLLPNC